MTSPMHQKKWLRLLSTRGTQKYFTALVRKKIAWHYRALFQTWNIGLKWTTITVLQLQPWWRTPYRVAEEKDLGVTITSSISWDSHIHNIVAKANNLLGLLNRTCPLLKDVNVRRTLYLSLVMSHLSYATQVWSSNQYSFKAKIERVRRRATLWIPQTRVDEIS